MPLSSPSARRRTDRGASALEYVGLIVLAALILGGLYAAGIPGRLGPATQHAICTILGQRDCGTSSSGNGPSDQGRPGGTAHAGAVPRFTGGLVDGVTSLATPPYYERETLPVQAQVVPAYYPDPGGGRTPRGGDNSTEHNRVALDTKRLIQQEMGKYVTGGQVTVDCEPGGSKANCVPGGHKSGNGAEGRADVVLRGTDKKTGKPVIYIWEVKPANRDGRLEAPGQLARYIRQKQKEVGPGTEVKYGFNLPNSTGIPGNGNRVLSAWSEGDSTNPANPSRGVRFYGGKEKKKQPQRQPQEQPQPNPHPVTPCGGAPPMALKEKKECPVPIFPGFPELPGLPEIPGIPFPEPVPVL